VMMLVLRIVYDQVVFLQRVPSSFVSSVKASKRGVVVYMI
jgi:hypothetical protein